MAAARTKVVAVNTFNERYSLLFPQKETKKENGKSHEQRNKLQITITYSNGWPQKTKIKYSNG